jgi:hypothetical protein
LRLVDMSISAPIRGIAETLYTCPPVFACY